MTLILRELQQSVMTDNEKDSGRRIILIILVVGIQKFASCHSSGSLEGGCPSSAEVIEDTEDFVYYSGFYSLFSVPTDL